MRTSSRIGAVITVAAMLSACAMEPPQETVERSNQGLFFWQQFFVKVSMDLVGRGLNGVALNGEDLAEHIVVAVSLENVDMPKGADRDLTLKRTLFRGSHSGGKSLGNRDMEGAIFTAYLDNGAPIKVRIEEAVATGDIDTYYRYRVSYEHADGWSSLCGHDDDGAELAAVPLNGVWDYRQGVEGGGAWFPSDNTFTFACDGFVLAKCVAMGYQPWAEGKVCDSEGNGSDCVKTDLALHHQACTRAMRADYCGDGTPHTVDGTEINLFDGIGIRLDTEDWYTEAEWDAEGARCAVKERIPSQPLPSCIEAIDAADCGDEAHAADGTLLFTEVNGD